MELEPIELSLDGMVVTIVRSMLPRKTPSRLGPRGVITVTLPAGICRRAYLAAPLTIHGKPAGGTPESRQPVNWASKEK